MIALLVSIIALVFSVAVLLVNMHTYGSMIDKTDKRSPADLAAVWVFRRIEQIRR
jgi:hypothetical protein